MMISNCGTYKKEGSHLFEIDGGYWIHCYQNARHEKDTEKNLHALIREYEEYSDEEESLYY